MGISDSHHGLHLHSFIMLSLKLQSENVGTYVHFEFIYKNTSVKSLIIVWFSIFLQITKKLGYRIH